VQLSYLAVVLHYKKKITFEQIRYKIECPAHIFKKKFTNVPKHIFY
jgi:hypothetical protein